MSEDKLLLYKVRIKDWEKAFLAANGKLPSKADVKADLEIRKAYKKYNQLKASKDAKGSKPQREAENEQKSENSAKTRSSDLIHIDINLTEDEEEQVELVRNAELGPTPQANGKVLSIFDMVLSPPESSPLKQRGQFLVPGASSIMSPTKSGPHEFKTPTKSVKRLELSDLTPSRGDRPSLMARLELASSAKAITPTSASKGLVETPFYLGKVNNKFLFREDGEQKSGEASLPSTPTKSPSIVNFQVSPSPLKSQRFLSFGRAKKVSDIFMEYQSMQLGDEFEAQKLEVEREFQANEEVESEKVDEEHPLMAARRKKAKTQKRTTRRWKIKPKSGEAGDDFEGKDVHQEMERIKVRQHDELVGYMEGHTESEESEEEEFVAPTRPASTKINPVSNNYKRLKINDPRAKKFKQRMRRR